MNTEPEVIIVSEGCISVGTGNVLFRSTPLGSCVAIAAYNRAKKTGGLAHILLPGKAPNGRKEDSNKYAENAVSSLLNELAGYGISGSDLEIVLIGGANVLKDEKDDIPARIVESITEVVKKNKLKLVASSLGGVERRTAVLDLATGVVKYTIGNSRQKILKDFSQSKCKGNPGEK